jgi:O-antigen/teichoic acid export membrane protein
VNSGDNHAKSRRFLGQSPGNWHRDVSLEGGALSKSGSEFLWVAAPKVLSAAAQLVVNLLLVRQLGPELSGIVFVCITAILLSDALLGSALDVAVLRLATAQRAWDAPDALETQLAAVLLKLTGCVALGIPILIWARPLGRILFHSEGNSHLLWLSVAALFGLLLLRSVQARFQVSRWFVMYGLTDLLHSCVKFGGIGLMLGIHQVTPASVLALYVAGPLSVSLVMLATASRDILTARLSKPAIGRLFNLFKWYAGGAAAGSITSRMDIFLVSSFAGSRQAGLFSAAQTFTLPFQMIGMYLGIVFAPRIMPLWEKGRLLPAYRRFQIAVIVLCVICYAIVLAAAPASRTSLLPPSFKGTGVLVLLLLPSSLAALVNFPWTVSFLMFSYPRFLMFFDACAFAVLGLIYWQCIIRYGAVGAAVVTSVFALLKTTVLQLLAIATLKRHPRADHDHVRLAPELNLVS